MWEPVGEETGRWQDHVNSETGEHSVKYHNPKVIWKSCKPEDHFFELSGNREVTCNKCGFSKPFILGQEILRDGKLAQVDK